MPDMAMQFPVDNTWRRRGVAVILSGPSGAGKTTVYRRFLEQRPDVAFSVSCTTRSPRKGEVDGHDYSFLTVRQFQDRVEAGLFLEHAEVHGNWYGTLRSEVEEPVSEGRDVLLDIDVQGARLVRQQIAGSALAEQVTFVFCGPPSFAELERRLRGRGTEDENTVQHRLHNAGQELAAWNEYEFLVINDVIEKAVDDLSAIFRACRCRTSTYVREV